METDKESVAADDGEDLPSDFFDDFNKADFMEGLSVVDSWNDDDKAGPKRELASSGSRINAETLDSVKDLRELIGDTADDEKDVGKNGDDSSAFPESSRRSSSYSRLDDFIKPGSRRDPSKTNEAIKRDKEEKVKVLLAKQLESSDDLRPPGTELDDFFEDRPKESKKAHEEVKKSRRSPNSKRRASPGSRRSAHRSPRRRSAQRRSPQRRSPQRRSPLRRSPVRRSPRRSPRRRSPLPYRSIYQSQYSFRRTSPSRYNKRHSPTRRSPRRYSPKGRSPHRYSPKGRSPQRRRSRSPRKRSQERKSLSRSRSPYNDSFLYPQTPDVMMPGPFGSAPPFRPMTPNFGPPMSMEFGGGIPRFPYSQPYSAPYDYGASSAVMPQAVPEPATVMMQTPAAEQTPVMVPPPGEALTSATSHPGTETKTPYDALAQLVADGKLSKEDYLKLAPNKGVPTTMDTKTRVMVLTRCSTALQKLSNLHLPNRLLINNSLVGPEPKYLAPKFSSPLKRQAPVEFHFSKTKDSSAGEVNKQIVDSIITALKLEDIVTRHKRKAPKEMKDAAVQTTKPYCDVCEIRGATEFQDASTEIDREHFSSAVHTQVLEEDLINSKSVFNPSGSVSDGGTMSIAHMTPAQLVSQLAARAKTLKQADPGPSGGNPNLFRRNPNYEYDGRSGGQYQNYNNYRY